MPIVSHPKTLLSAYVLNVAMFSLNDTMRYFLCPGRTDMRKGISSLYGLMSEKMKSEVRNGDVFILVGSSRKLMKLRHAGGRQAVELIQVNQSEPGVLKTTHGLLHPTPAVALYKR